MRAAALIAGFVLLAVLPGCGGGSDEAGTTLAAEPSPPKTTAGGTSRVETRLASAGYYVVRSTPSPELRGVRFALTTGVGEMLVYIAGFRTAKAAADYAASVAATARENPKHVVARRAGRTVYSAVAAQSPKATATAAPLLELIAKVEGAKVRPVRISPR